MNRREALQRTASLTGFAITASAGIGFLEGCRPSGDPDWNQSQEPNINEGIHFKMVYRLFF